MEPIYCDRIDRAIDDGVLPHESAAFEVKTQLPASRSSGDVAVDVAAMATDGGVIVYGVREDKAAVTFSSTPIELAGAKDRISDIVAASVRERIEFDVRLLPLDDDPAHGFVVIDIPASIRAPHMVETKGEFRFYGRVPGGNVMLTEAQIALLYERRRYVESESERYLGEWIEHAPIPPTPDVRGDLFIVVRPLLSDTSLRARAWSGDEGTEMANAILRAESGLRFTTLWDPHLASTISGGRRLPTMDGFALFNPPIVRDGEQIDEYVSLIEVLDDGTVRYFHAALAALSGDGSVVLIRDTAVAQIAAHLSLFAGNLLEVGGYHGPVDVGLALTGASGGTSAEWLAPGRFPPPGGLPALPTNDYQHRIRVPAVKLRKEPCGVAQLLLTRLFRALRPAGFPDPLQR